MNRLLYLLMLLLCGCSRCGAAMPPVVEMPEGETEREIVPVAVRPEDPPIATPVPLRLVIHHPPAAIVVHESPADCRAIGTTSGSEKDGVSEVVAVGPAGAAALYPTLRLSDGYSLATFLSVAADGTPRTPAQLRIRGLLVRMQPLNDGFLVVTAHNDFSVGLIRRYYAYVLDPDGRFGGSIVITGSEDRGELDGIGSADDDALRFFYAPNPTRAEPMIIVEVRRDETGALVRRDVNVDVHVPGRGAPGRSMVVALPPAAAEMALILHPDSGPELLRGTEVSPVELLPNVRGSWLLGNPVRAIATSERTLVHVAGEGIFAINAAGAWSRQRGDAQPATTIGEVQPVAGRLVGGDFQIEGDLPRGKIAWAGTTMAEIADGRLTFSECARRRR